MTMYVFHHWIEASETGNTVYAVFGPWWDGNAGGGGGGNPWYYYAQQAG